MEQRVLAASGVLERRGSSGSNVLQSPSRPRSSALKRKPGRSGDLKVPSNPSSATFRLAVFQHPSAGAPERTRGKEGAFISRPGLRRPGGGGGVYLEVHCTY